MIGRDQHCAGVEVHEDLAGQLGQLFNGELDVVEGIYLGATALVTAVIDHVVIDVYQLLIFKRFASSVTGPLFDLQCRHGHAAMQGKSFVASDGVASIESVYENTITAFAILQRLVWQQGGHA